MFCCPSVLQTALGPIRRFLPEKSLLIARALAYFLMRKGHAREADKVHVLVERIYDTVLDTHAWPDVLQDIAYATGASGAMVFELTQSATGGQIACPHLSANYDRDAVLAYLANHNDQEIIDQAHFAKVSGQDPKITLINDSAFPVTPDELRAQANVQDMLSFGLCHRSGTLLNKDTW